jgi:hypothetical protein
MLATMVALFTLAVPFVSSKIRADSRLSSAVLFVLLTHQSTSIFQVILDGLPTMRMDPLAFNQFAMTGVGRLATENYAKFLHWTYQVFGATHLLGCEISQFFFSIALILEIELLYRLGCTRRTPVLILAFGLLPSCILNTSVTLREPAQIAFFLGITLILVNIVDRGLTAASLLIVPTAIGLIELHQGFAAVIFITAPLALAWALRKRPAVLLLLGLSVLASGLIFAERLKTSLSERSYAFKNISAGNLDYVERYSQQVEQSRTSFGVTLDLSSPRSALQTSAEVFVCYLYSPLPWQVKGLLDLYGLLESMLRLSLTFFAIKALFQSTGAQRDRLVLLSILFVTMEAAWAAGTANWGTAFRHRLVAWGLLVVLGGCDDTSGNAGPEGTLGRGNPKPLPLRGLRQSIRETRQSSATSGHQTFL